MPPAWASSSKQAMQTPDFHRLSSTSFFTSSDTAYIATCRRLQRAQYWTAMDRAQRDTVYMERSFRGPSQYLVAFWWPAPKHVTLRRMSREKITPPTLEQMRQSAPWLWAYCNNPDCLRRTPLALTPFII